MEKRRQNIAEVNIEGDEGHLELTDGSRFFVNPGDLPTVALWLPGTPVGVALDDFNSVFSYKLTNLDDNVSVWAIRVI